ncbi:WD40 repeat-like protein [Obba rivulosa]|uniref:WD40 repeat-like protein n=1 Tax=Obba rivulosa TaxID=1052685 RepID=A0A8E2AZZ4_9APHY|nr:WD40 repeat-like protein [Obba rivulosa]
MESPPAKLDEKLAFSLSPEDSGTVVGILSVAKTVIDGLDPILGAAPIPGIDLAAKSLSHLIDMLQQTKENDETAKALARKLHSFAVVIEQARNEVQTKMMAVSNGNVRRDGISEAAKEDPQLADLLDNIGDLAKALMKLEATATELQNSPYMLRCIKHAGNTKVLLKLNDGVSEATWVWQFRSGVKRDLQLAAVAANVGTIRDAQDTQEVNQLLQQLRPARAHFRTHPNWDKDILYEQQQQQLITKLIQWAKGENVELGDQRFCVLTGPIGSGKSTIVLQLIDYLEREKLLGASFFFSDAEENCRVTKRVFPSIAFQLVRAHQDLRPALINGIREHIDLDLGENERMDHQAKNCLEKPLKEISETRNPVIIVIDAADVCTDPPDVIAMMFRLFLRIARSAKFPIRFLVTTTPEERILKALNSEEFRGVVRKEEISTVPPIITIANLLHTLKGNTDQVNGRAARTSFPQYPTQEQTDADGDAICHAHLATMCLRILIEDEVLRRNPCELAEPARYGLDSKVSASSIHVDRHIPAHVEYACVLWTTHIQKASGDPSTLEALEEFCLGKKKLLYWLELLGYLDQLDVALRTLHSVRLWYERHATQKTLVSQVLHGVHRIALDFNDIISVSPEQLYISVWPQIPACPLFELYKIPSETAPMKLLTPRDTKWSPFLFDIQTLRGRLVGVKVDLNGRYIASCALYGQIDLWDAISGAHLLKITNISGADSFDIAWEHQRVVSCREGGNQIYLYDDAADVQPALLSAEGCRFSSVVFSRDGRIYSPVLEDTRVLVWDAGARTLSDTIQCEKAVSTTIDFAADGTRAVSGSSCDVCVWDIENGTVLTLLEGHTDQVLSAVFFPDGDKVASSSRDADVRIWDIESKTTAHVLHHPTAVSQAVVSPAGDFVASASDAIRLWNPETGEVLAVLKGNPSPVTSICFSMSGLRLISSSWDGAVRVWDMASIGPTSTESAGHQTAVTCLAYSSDGQLVASGGADRRIIVWDALTGEHKQTLEGHDSEILHVAFSPDGTRLISTASQDHCRVWELSTGQMAMSITHRDAYLAAFSLDGKWIITGRRSLQPLPLVADNDADRSDIRLFGASDGQIEKDFRFPPNAGSLDLESLEFSPSGTHIHAVCSSSAVYGFDIATGRVALVPDKLRPKISRDKIAASPQHGWITLPGPDKRRVPVCWLQRSRRPAVRSFGDGKEVCVSRGHQLGIGSDNGRVTLLDLSNLALEPPPPPVRRKTIDFRSPRDLSVALGSAASRAAAVLTKPKASSGDTSITDTLPDIADALSAAGTSLSELKSTPLFGGLENAVYSLYALTEVLQITKGKEYFKRELVQKIEELTDTVKQSKAEIENISSSQVTALILKKSSPLIALLDVTEDLADMLHLFAQIQEIEQVEAKNLFVRFKQKARTRKTDVVFTVKDGIEDAYDAVAHIVSRGRIKVAKLISEVATASTRITTAVKQIEEHITEDDSRRLHRQRGVAQSHISFDRGKDSSRNEQRLQLLQELSDLAEGIKVGSSTRL